jgi:hypothetical protein
MTDYCHLNSHIEVAIFRKCILEIIKVLDPTMNRFTLLRVVLFFTLALSASPAFTQCWPSQKVVVDDRSNFDRTGTTASMTEKYAVAGAPSTRFFQFENVGSIAVFEIENNQWVFKQQILPERISDGNINFGISVDISGNSIVVGAPTRLDSNLNGIVIRSGSAYIYVRNSEGRWILQDEFNGTVQSNQSYFGEQVAISGNWLAISAPHNNAVEDGDTVYGLGAVYLYQKQDNDQWALQQIIKNPRSKTFVGFGQKIKLKDSTLLLSTLDQIVHIYVVDKNNNWVLQQTITSPLNGFFGRGLAIGEKYVAIGAPMEIVKVSTNMFTPSGVVRIYQKTNEGLWELNAEIPNPIPRGEENFGWSIDFEKDALVVGTPWANPSNINLPTGAVYYFQQFQSEWQLREVFQSPDVDQHDQFGADVKLEGEWLLISSPLDDDGVEAEDDTIEQAGSLTFYRKRSKAYCEPYNCSLAFPNPSSGLFFLGNLGNQTVDVIDLGGKQLSIDLRDGYLDLSNLPSSMYFVRTDYCNLKLVKR